MSDEWKKRLLPASFRGIPFFVREHDHRGGRNIVGHEIVDRDDGFSEDTGGQLDSFIIEAEIMGDNYFFIRDGLISAMKDRSDGLLIHPYLGPKTVKPGQYRLVERTTEGRICFLTLQFKLSGTPFFPLAIIDKATDFFTTAVVAVAQVQNAFQVAYKVAELPGLLASSTALLLRDFVTTVIDGYKNVKVNPDEFANILQALKKIDNNAETLATSPATLAATMGDVIGDFSDAVSSQDQEDNDTIDTSSGADDKLAVYDATALSFETGWQNISIQTPTDEQEFLNAKALEELVQQIGIFNKAGEAVAKDFVSKEQAIQIREEIVAELDRLASQTTDDEAYQAIKDVKESFVDAVPGAQTDLAEIVQREISVSLPSLVVAYELYESVELETDLVRRNRIRNPGFVQGNIEVLSVAP